MMDVSTEVALAKQGARARLDWFTRLEGCADAFLRSYSILLYFILYAPSLVLGVLSFNDSFTMTLPWRGFTFRWYEALLRHGDVAVSFKHSLGVALSTMFVSTVLGTLCALGMRRRFRGNNWVYEFMLLPLVTPGIISGISVFLLFTHFTIIPSLYGSVLVGHIVFALPYVFLVVYARVQALDPRLEEAALDLGANEARTFFHVTLPLLMPGVVGGALFAFLLSFDEFIRTYFLSGGERTLPMLLWGMLFDVLSPEVAALATVMLCVSIGLLLIAQYWTRK